MKTPGKLTDTQLAALESEYASLLEQSKSLVQRLYELHPTRRDPHNRDEEIKPPPSAKVRGQIKDIMDEEARTRREAGELKTRIDSEKAMRSRSLGRYIKGLLS